jgi:hypothetical protein
MRTVTAKTNRLNIALGILLVVLTVLSVSGVLDSQGLKLTERGFSRSLIAFAAARGLNGVISVAQGTEFALQPAGIGVNFTPGQILDPLNDLVERFSWVMLAASTSLGIQRLLIEISGSGLFAFGAGVFFLIAAYFIVFSKKLQAESKQRVLKAALVLLILRFGIVVLAVGSELIFTSFLTEGYEEAYAQIQSTAGEMETLNQNEQVAIKAQRPTDSSWIATIKDRAAQLTSTFDFNAKIDAYKASAAELSRSTINLVVIFLFQTLLLPLAFLSVLISLMKSIFWW